MALQLPSSEPGGYIVHIPKLGSSIATVATVATSISFVMSACGTSSTAVTATATPTPPLATPTASASGNALSIPSHWREASFRSPPFQIAVPPTWVRGPAHQAGKATRVRFNGPSNTPGTVEGHYEPLDSPLSSADYLNHTISGVLINVTDLTGMIWHISGQEAACLSAQSDNPTGETYAYYLCALVIRSKGTAKGWYLEGIHPGNDPSMQKTLFQIMKSVKIQEA